MPSQAVGLQQPNAARLMASRVEDGQRPQVLRCISPAGRERDEVIAQTGLENRISTYKEGASPLFDQNGERTVDLVFVARIQDMKLQPKSMCCCHRHDVGRNPRHAPPEAAGKSPSK